MQEKGHYSVRITQDFEEQYEKLVKRDPKLKRRIESRIDELSNDPFAGTLPLTYGYQGWREDRFGDYRFLLAICKECRQMRNPRLDRCYDCDDMELTTIKLMEVGHRSDMWKHR